MRCRPYKEVKEETVVQRFAGVIESQRLRAVPGRFDDGLSDAFIFQFCFCMRYGKYMSQSRVTRKFDPTSHLVGQPLQKAILIVNGYCFQRRWWQEVTQTLLNRVCQWSPVM